jgi:hypothetical protein
MRKQPAVNSQVPTPQLPNRSLGAGTWGVGGVRGLRHLFPILGARAAVAFGSVAFLIAALLATVHLTSRHALKLYVEDQLRRVRWDLAVYQKGPAGESLQRVPGLVRSVDGIDRVETVAFLRAQFPERGEVVSMVDGRRIRSPWVSLLSASDLSILPPQLRFALSRSSTNGDPAEGASSSAVLALVGPERDIGDSFLDLQGARQFVVGVHVGGFQHVLFETSIKQVIRLERDELNRWFMDQTGSITFVPHIGLIVLMPFEPDILARFDSVAAGLVPEDMQTPGDPEIGHVQEAEYEPEVAYLARIDRDQLISGWDIGGSLERVTALALRVRDAAREADRMADRDPDDVSPVVFVDDPPKESRPVSNRFIVDSTTEVLLMRMERLSRVVGLVTVLVALPLLCVAWLLAASLAGLLMLNERRLLGLMRLRGVPGEAMGHALLVAIIAGGTIGGAAGLVAGSVGTLAVYEGGRVPLSVLLTPSQVFAAIQLIVISVAMAFFVSRRLVRYATTISPLEAARRIETSEAERAALRFGRLQAAALVVGAYVLVSWVAPAAAVFSQIPVIGRALDFVGMPLFVYGIAVLLASRRRQMQAAVAPMARLAAGTLGPLAEKHIAVKPHRTLAFLLIVALMVSVSLYPLITSGSFEEKAARGARVQIGADWQLLFNSPDLTDVSRLQGGLGEQREALREPIERLASQVAAVPGVTGVTYLIEALLPNIYLPDYGLRGVPAYLVGDTADYLETVYTEPELGITDTFARLTGRLAEGDVVVSQAVAQFKKLTPGSRLRLGIDGNRRGVVATTAGVVAQLPGIPARSVTDRQGYVEARIDYLNHLFSNNAYVIASADNPSLAQMRVVIPRVILLINASPDVAADAFRQRLIAALPFPPLEVHNLDEELSKVASDMYISLVLANIQIYLFGGLVLALVAIVSVSAANYVEDRRTLALLRIRGASPLQLWRFMLALLLSPAVVGLAIGAAVALIAGYGLANHVWDLREIKTVVQRLDTRLVLSSSIGSLAALLVAMLVAAVSAFSWWVFRRTAHRTLQET